MEANTSNQIYKVKISSVDIPSPSISENNLPSERYNISALHDMANSAYELSQYLQQTERIVKINGTLALYDSQSNCYRFLAGKQADPLLRAIIPENVRKKVHAQKLTEVLRWLESPSTSIGEVSYNELHTRRKYLNFKNGCLNLKSLILSPPRDYYFEFCINAEYDESPSGKGKHFKKFLKTSFADNKDLIRRFQEVLGLAISNIREQKVMIFVYGSTNSGKSVVLNLIRHLIGETHTSSLSLTDIVSQFRTSELFGKWVNLGSEVNDLSVKSTDVIKRITGNDTITAEFKFQLPFTFRNTALLMFAMNEWPKMGQLDDPGSFLGRIEVLPMSQSLSRDEWDDNLLDKLIKEKEHIIHFAIQGLLRFIKNGYQFSPCLEADEIKEANSLIENSFYHFSREYITYDTSAKTSSQAIGAAYESFCDEMDIMPEHASVWSKWLAMQPGVRHRRGFSEGPLKNLRGFQGVRLIGGEDSE